MNDLISRQSAIKMFLDEGMPTAAVYIERMEPAHPDGGTIMNVALPYLRAIEILIKDSFPDSNVKVFVEESPFFKGYIAIKAYVDNYGAYTTVDVNHCVNEQGISDILISKIKEVKPCY